MSNRATLFIALTTAAACVLVTETLWTAPDFRHKAVYLVFCLLTMAASTLKIRLPGLTGTISVNFVFVLMAVVLLTCAETALIGCLAGMIQCLWKPKRRPALRQVVFNTAVLAISSMLSYRVAHAMMPYQQQHVVVVLAIAAAIYFATDTLLVSGVISLVENRPVLETWRVCYLWSFPYYLVGAAIAAIAGSAYQAGGWLPASAVLLSVYMMYLFYRMLVQRIGHLVPASTLSSPRS